MFYTSVYEGKRREFYGMAPGDIVFELEKQYILEQAKRGDCIIVGRCAEEILKDTGHFVVNVFVTAPFSYRLERKRRELGKRDRWNPGEKRKYMNLEAEIHKVDKRRRAYYEYHTGKDWGQPHNYDVCLNSATMGIDRIARLIAESFEKLTKGESK